MEKEKASIAMIDTDKQTEDFFAVLDNCTMAEKQFFAGVLEGMKFQQSLNDQRSA